MRSVAMIRVSSTCRGWQRVCPDAPLLARRSARIALADGIAAKDLLSPGHIEIAIELTDDARQKQLNRRYRGQDTSTNVLAFPLWEPGMKSPPGAPLLLGDVVLAFETVAREAGEQCKAFDDHFRHLVVHGVLHLVGCDHQSDVEAVEMEALETAILGKLGVPDPYR